MDILVEGCSRQSYQAGDEMQVDDVREEDAVDRENVDSTPAAVSV